MIALITDFGTEDWFVGVLKGVIHETHAEARILDITHGIPAGDLRAGAFALKSACRFLPRGTVCVVVVDPGVGGPRSPIAVRTERGCFLAPDNGVLSWALRFETVREIRRLECRELWRQPVSRTFHGRDVFAPAAAHLEAGLAFETLGPLLDDLIRLPWPAPRREGRAVFGEVVYVDHFGNAITNLGEEDAAVEGADLEGELPGGVRFPVRGHYGAVSAGEPVGVFGSTGFLEVAVNGGTAAGRLGLAVGTPVVLRPAGPGGSTAPRGGLRGC